MPTKFNKDAWILRALKAEHIRAWSDGTIYRVREGGLLYKRVEVSTHKKTGRVYFTLTFEGVSKSVLVNRVVALALIPNPLNLPEVNHKDGVKAHNWESNLEWSTGKRNKEHAHETGLTSIRGSANPNAKLDAGKVLFIRDRARTLKNVGEPIASTIATELRISEGTVRAVLTGRTWSHV